MVAVSSYIEPLVPQDVPPGQEVIAAPAWGPGGWPGLYAVSAALAERAFALPTAVDDLDYSFGLDLKRQMARDPLIAAAERVLLTAALNQPIQWGNPAPRTSPDYATASRYAGLVREMCDGLPTPLEATLFEMGTAARQTGHCLGELVEDVATVLPGYGPLRIYTAIKPKPWGSYALVQDGFANFLGVAPRLTLPWPSTGELSGGLLNGAWPVYAPEHFALLPWNPFCGDPRGRSAYTAVYGAWYKKRQAEPGLLAMLARFGQPGLDLEMAPNTPDEQPDATGTLRKSTDLYLAMGQAFQAGGVQVRPPGSKSTLLEASGDGAAYLGAERHWNAEILLGLLGQTLSMLEGEHRSGSDAKTHQDMLALLVRFTKRWLATFVDRQLVRPLLLRNFGPAALPLAPVADLGQTEPEDLAAMLNSLSQLAGPGGYWNPDIVPDDIGAALDLRVGLPQRQTGVGVLGPGGTPADTAPIESNPEGVPA